MHHGGCQSSGQPPEALMIHASFFSPFPLYKASVMAKLRTRNDNFMRNIFPFFATVVVAGVFSSGCANTQTKLGRGMSNMTEIVRMGEIRREVEQTALFDQPGGHYATGFVRGLSKTFARTGVGIYEVVTAPFPPYDPIFTDYLSPNPVYPDNYQPGLIEDSLFATDTNMGFSGGDVAPYIPGSRFKIFNTQ
jgi:putative exosortase-associated protein (TIGR04073 family)